MIEETEIRTVLLEFNKGLNITSCQTWFRNYNGDRISKHNVRMGYNDRRYNPFSIKTPTLKHNGFKVQYDRVWGEVARWRNKDIVVWVLRKYKIKTNLEVLYDIKKEPQSSGANKSVQIFYRVKQ